MSSEYRFFLVSALCILEKKMMPPKKLQNLILKTFHLLNGNSTLAEHLSPDLNKIAKNLK